VGARWIQLLEYTAEPPPALQLKVMTGARMIMSLSKELGLTPLSRARLAAELPSDNAEVDAGFARARFAYRNLLRGAGVHIISSGAAERGWGPTFP
jgi:hypothetical protein